MELNKNEKEIYWNDIKMSILKVLIISFPIIMFIFSGKIAKIMNGTITQVNITSVPIILFIELEFLSLLAKYDKENEILRNSEKRNKKLNEELQQNEKEYQENMTALNYVFSEIEKHNYTMTYELLRITGLEGPEMRKEFKAYVCSNPPKDYTPELFNRLTRENGKTNSRITPFPTKQEALKHVAKEAIQDSQHMTTLDYIESKIKKHNYPITHELETILRNGRENLREEFDKYVRVQKEFDEFMHNILNKQNKQASVDPGVNPILSDLINQIQTHGDNIIVKQQGQQLTIKATLNQEPKTQENQWGDY